MVESCKLSDNATLADVGCGTGISSRLFARRGINVIGVEPNADMLAMAKKNSTGLSEHLRFVSGTAEDTTLTDGSVDTVLCAQSFHWFNQEKAFQEFHRILKDHSFIVLMWNIWDFAHPCTQAYAEIIERLLDPKISEAKLPMPIFPPNMFVTLPKCVFANSQTLDRSLLIDRVFSTSYAPVDEKLSNILKAELNILFDKFSKDDALILQYETHVYKGQKF